MLANIGTTEILLVCGVMLVLFGGNRIPKFVRAMGDSVTEFRSAVKSE
jgi:sec-independent protein translocase protein TatA